jgi:dihydropteroate synthase
MINDVSALRMDPEMGATAARCRVPIILMHMKGTPKDHAGETRLRRPVSDIMTFLSDAMDRAVAAGVNAPPSSSIRESGSARPLATTFSSSVI